MFVAQFGGKSLTGLDALFHQKYRTPHPNAVARPI